MNYDPNLSAGLKKTEQEVHIILRVWDYERLFVVPIIGNKLGFAVINTAVEMLFDELSNMKSEGLGSLELLNEDTGEVLNLAEVLDYQDEFEDLIVSAKIVSIKLYGEEKLN